MTVQLEFHAWHLILTLIKRVLVYAEASSHRNTLIEQSQSTKYYNV